MKIVNSKELDNKMKYHCGSPNLKEHLEKNGFSPIDAYINKKNDRTIWVFILTKELSRVLYEWSANKPLSR